jgi:hypothetical protein
MRCEELENQPRGVFVPALQQVVDSFVAGLLTDEAFRWLSKQEQEHQIPPDGLDTR